MRLVSVAMIWVLMGMFACSSSTSDPKDTGNLDSSSDVAKDIPGDADDVSGDTIKDESTPDTADIQPDTAQCSPGVDWECLNSDSVLRTCEDGMWVTVNCHEDGGKFCEEGKCVAPWEYGNPQWGECLDEEGVTAESLAEKAASYDNLVPRLHLHPKLKFVAQVTLPGEDTECPDGEVGPCSTLDVPLDEATYEDVVSWSSGENDGLWSSHYLASQAFRYAVTGSQEALENIRVLMDGEVIRMEITGVPGNFTRQYAPPDMDGLSCPIDLTHYIPDVEKDDNRWVKIGESGCAEVVNGDTMEWVTTEHCGLDKYVGWCFLDNVSQDEYAGHMFALPLVAKLVDDPEIQGMASSLLEQVGVHLMEHELTVVDWDGRNTEHGWLFPTSMSNTPGFLAVLSMSYIYSAAVESKNEELLTYYNDCLMQRSGELDCFDWPTMNGQLPFQDYLEFLSEYIGSEGCKSNWNNFSMIFSAWYILLQYEFDPAARALLQSKLDTELMRANQSKALIAQKNPWFNFMWATTKKLGPNSDGPALQAVEEAICTLKQFPATKTPRARNNNEDYEHYCDDRLDHSLTEDPVAMNDRCLSTFQWWANPYRRNECGRNDRVFIVPGDYLLAYWMGRYYGFIKEGM